MRDTLLRLGRPYVERYVAGLAGVYLTERRRRRLQRQAEAAISAELLPVELSLETPERRAPTLWFILSGLLLGSAFGAIIYLLARDSR
jgi:hypothetical protein